jgi:TATA-binding protein-associated factor
MSFRYVPFPGYMDEERTDSECRTDKLVLLLDTGTSSQVRRTAAKQLADITLKTFRAAPPDKSKDEPASIEQIKFEDVKPEINVDGTGNEATSLTVEGQVGQDDAWAEVLDTIARLLPLIKSRSSETRAAASNALGLLAASLPPYTTDTIIPKKDEVVSHINVQALLSSGETLLASAGREYVAKPMTGTDKAKRRKAMMGSLGLGDVGWGDDVDQVIGEDDDAPLGSQDKNGEASGSRTEATPTTPQDIFEGLSSRQVTMLKRKKGDIVAEANKYVQPIRAAY